jgi:16S rRNA (guanine527-N7)-methyltransferase
MPRGLSDIPEHETRDRLNRYLDCLQRWSQKINLTGAETRDAAFETLIAPVLGGEAFLRGHVVDVGSGNGSPGLILAAMRPDLMFSLLEPRAKRWAFLREAARAMGLNNTEARRERSEDYKGGAADTITMRAVGLAPIQLRPLLAPGGCVLVFGGPDLPGAETLTLPDGARLQRCCFT